MLCFVAISAVSRIPYALVVKNIFVQNAQSGDGKKKIYVFVVIVMLIRSLSAKNAVKNMNYCSNQIRIWRKLTVKAGWKSVRAKAAMNLSAWIARIEMAH